MANSAGLDALQKFGARYAHVRKRVEPTAHAHPGRKSINKLNVETVRKDLQRFYKEHSTPSRLRCLKLSMFMRKAPQYPKLRGL